MRSPDEERLTWRVPWPRLQVSTYDELRKDFDETKYEAWLNGRTGFPMVDACMRSLHHSGWLNFRMRCLLVSFASYQLWLDWRRLTPVMARLFLDYEPGIHYPQFQMQAGTTGINATRIYSPAKQAEDHAGGDYEFIRRWVRVHRGGCEALALSDVIAKCRFLSWSTCLASTW